MQAGALVARAWLGRARHIFSQSAGRLLASRPTNTDDTLWLMYNYLRILDSRGIGHPRQSTRRSSKSTACASFFDKVPHLVDLHNDRPPLRRRLWAAVSSVIPDPAHDALCRDPQPLALIKPYVFFPRRTMLDRPLRCSGSLALPCHLLVDRV